MATTPYLPASSGEQEALLATLRQSLLRPLLYVTAAALVIAALSGFGTIAFADWRDQSSAVAGVIAAVAGGAVTAVVLMVPLARRLADLTARPIGMLLNSSPGLPNSYHWQGRRALRGEEANADLNLLEERHLEVIRRSDEMTARLEERRELADESSAAKSQFLAAMSHELRTPLNAILGYTALLAEDANAVGNATAVADLLRVEQAGRNLLQIINDVLDLSRIESGRVRPTRSVVDVQTLVRRVAQDCAAAPVNGNRFQLEIAPEIGIMIGDANRIGQCLGNLLSNAFKFTQSGEIALLVGPAEHDGRPWLSFAVTDTGIGIDSAKLETLFNAFQQGDGGATRSHGGTGLGLALVRQLSRLMGGDCIVESAPNRGSTFTLLLPYEPALELRPRVPETLVSTVSPTARTVLVIDDDEAVVDLMRRWLNRLRFNVIATTDPDHGLELARLHCPDVILLDAIMPHRSGYDLLDAFADDERVSRIPTVLVTVDDDRARALKAGAADHLRKPVSERQLGAALDVYSHSVSGAVLVIEDDDDAADLVSRSLGQIGLSCRRAADGLEGLAMAADQRPGAIVLDLTLPTIQGFDVIDRLSADTGLCDVPVVVVSGRELSNGEHRRLIESGCRYMPKAEFSPRALAASVKDLFA